jgi:hypothetical protein
MVQVLLSPGFALIFGDTRHQCLFEIKNCVSKLPHTYGLNHKDFEKMHRQIERLETT